MIILKELTKDGPGSRPVLSGVSMTLPSDCRIALLGPSQRHKEIFINLLAGTTLPSSGQVIRHSGVSFPVGDLPGFSRDLSIRVNIAHVARLYGANVRDTLAQVENAFDGSKYFDRPYDELPRSLRKTLAQTVAFALPFDTYLLSDDRMYPKPRGRGRRARRRMASAGLPAVFENRMREAGFIIATEDVGFAEEHCDMSLLLDKGQLQILDSAQDGTASMSERRGRRRRRREE